MSSEKGGSRALNPPASYHPGHMSDATSMSEWSEWSALTEDMTSRRAWTQQMAETSKAEREKREKQKPKTRRRAKQTTDPVQAVPSYNLLYNDLSAVNPTEILQRAQGNRGTFMNEQQMRVLKMQQETMTWSEKKEKKDKSSSSRQRKERESKEVDLKQQQREKLKKMKREMSSSSKMQEPKQAPAPTLPPAPPPPPPPPTGCAAFIARICGGSQAPAPQSPPQLEDKFANSREASSSAVTVPMQYRQAALFSEDMNADDFDASSIGSDGTYQSSLVSCETRSISSIGLSVGSRSEGSIMSSVSHDIASLRKALNDDSALEDGLDPTSLAQQQCGVLRTSLMKVQETDVQDADALLPPLLKLTVLVQKTDLQKEVVWAFFNSHGVAILVNVANGGIPAVRLVCVTILAAIVLWGFLVNENNGTNYLDEEDARRVQKLMFSVIRKFDGQDELSLAVAERGMSLVFQCLGGMLEMGWDLPPVSLSKEFIRATLRILKYHDWPNLRAFGFGFLAVMSQKRGHDACKALIAAGCVPRTIGFMEKGTGLETEVDSQKTLLCTLCTSSKTAARQFAESVKTDNQPEALAQVSQMLMGKKE